MLEWEYKSGLDYKLKTLTEMKTYIKAIVLFAISAFAFTGCTKDEATTPPDYIKGKWKCSTRYVFTASGFSNVQEYWYFGESGNVILDATTWNNVDNWQNYEQRIGTYTFENNLLTINWTTRYVKNTVTVTDWLEYTINPPPPFIAQKVRLNNREMELNAGSTSYMYTREFE
jgi:hypothetical protein